MNPYAKLEVRLIIDVKICVDSTCIATGEKIKYLTAVLNSKLYCYFLTKNAPRTGMGDLIISVQALEPLYVHYPTDEEERYVVSILDEILQIKKKEPLAEISIYENRIDLMVYKMNNLEYIECKTIDASIDRIISEESYKNATLKQLSAW